MNPGWRNVTEECRAFGVPSVRSDIPAPERRSVADNQNYGHDVNAQYLLYPQEFAAKGITDDAFTIPRSRDTIVRMFTTVGYDVLAHDAALIERVWTDACVSTRYTPSGQVSIEDFRQALNRALVDDVHHPRHMLAGRAAPDRVPHDAQARVESSLY